MGSALPRKASTSARSLRGSEFNFILLANAYKQITAPVGTLGLASLKVSTRALAGDDDTYTKLENKLSALTQQRDALAAQIIQILEDAEFNGKSVDFKATVKLVTEAAQLLDEVKKLQHGD